MCKTTLTLLPVHFKTICVLRVQEDIPRFTVHAGVSAICHLHDELVIENAQHVKYSSGRSCAHEERRRQDPSSLTINYSLRR